MSPESKTDLLIESRPEKTEWHRPRSRNAVQAFRCCALAMGSDFPIGAEIQESVLPRLAPLSCFAEDVRKRRHAGFIRRQIQPNFAYTGVKMFRSTDSRIASLCRSSKRDSGGTQTGWSCIYDEINIGVRQLSMNEPNAGFRSRNRVCKSGQVRQFAPPRRQSRPRL